MNTLNIREEILQATHRWYVIVTFILVGGFIGWFAGFLRPSPYRATLNLYLGLNAYRSPYDSYASSIAEQSFRLVDDYKNWQMEQLNALVLTDPYLEEALTRLRSLDPYWDDVTPQEFRRGSDVLWRNVGEWHLVYENDDPHRAVQAVETWGGVILEWVGEAISHSKKVVALDVQMSTLEEQRVEKELRLDRLGYVSDQLKLIVDKLEDKLGDQAVSPTDHWKIVALLALVAEWSPVWEDLLNSVPQTGEVPQAYLEWLLLAQSMIAEELMILPEQITAMQTEFSAVAESYSVETIQSSGLASTLVIERISGEQPEVEPVIFDGIFSLVGGLIGFFAWGIWCLVKVNRSKL